MIVIVLNEIKLIYVLDISNKFMEANNRSRSTERRCNRSRSPERRRNRSRSPERRHGRSRSPNQSRYHTDRSHYKQYDRSRFYPYSRDKYKSGSRDIYTYGSRSRGQSRSRERSRSEERSLEVSMSHSPTPPREVKPVTSEKSVDELFSSILETHTVPANNTQEDKPAMSAPKIMVGKRIKLKPKIETGKITLTMKGAAPVSVKKLGINPLDVPYKKPGLKQAQIVREPNLKSKSDQNSLDSFLRLGNKDSLPIVKELSAEDKADRALLAIDIEDGDMPIVVPPVIGPSLAEKLKGEQKISTMAASSAATLYNTLYKSAVNKTTAHSTTTNVKYTTVNKNPPPNVQIQKNTNVSDLSKICLPPPV